MKKTSAIEDKMIDNKNETICLNMKNNSKNSTPVTESVSDVSCEVVKPSISKCETNFEENSDDSSTGSRHCDENKICLSDNFTNSEKTDIKRKFECLEISDTVNINVRNKMSNSGSDGFSDNCSVDEFEKMSDCQKTKLEKDNDTNIKDICNEKIKATISKVIVSDSLMSTLSNFRIYKEGKSSNENQECTENPISMENTDVINNASEIRERKDNDDDESKFKKLENCMITSLPQNIDLKTNASHDQISSAIDSQLNNEFQLSSKAIDASNIKVDANNISSNSDSSVTGNTSSLVYEKEYDTKITTHKKEESVINDDNILPSNLPLPLLNETSNCTSGINSRDKIILDIQNPKVNNIDNSITLETDQNNSSNAVLLKMPESKSLVKKDEYRHTVNLTTDIKSSHEAESQISLKDCSISNIVKGVSKSPDPIDNTDLSKNKITEYSECKEGSSINSDSINSIDTSEKEITENFQGEKGPSINPDSVKTTDLSKNKIAKYSQGEENTPANHDTIIITGLSKNKTMEYSPGEEDTSINNTVLSKNKDTKYSEGEISPSVNNTDLSKNDNTEYSQGEETPSINNTDLSKNDITEHSQGEENPSINNTDLSKNDNTEYSQGEENPSINNTDLSKNDITEHSQGEENPSINNTDLSKNDITEHSQGEENPSINNTDLSKNDNTEYSQGEENPSINNTDLPKNEVNKYSEGKNSPSVKNTDLSKNYNTEHSQGEENPSINNTDLSKNDNTEYSQGEENPSINNTDLSKDEVKKYSEGKNSPSVNNTDLLKNEVADHFQSEEGSSINSDPINKILLSMKETRDEDNPSISPKNLQSSSQPKSKPENDSTCTVDTDSFFTDGKSLTFAKENHVSGTNSSGQAYSLNNADVCKRSAVKQSSKEYEVNLTNTRRNHQTLQQLALKSLSDSKVGSLLKLNSEIKIIESGPKEEMKISSTDPKQDINCLGNDKTDITANKFDCSEYLKRDSNIYNLETQNSKFKVLENDICNKVSLSKNKENIVNSSENLQKASVDCNMDVCVNSLNEEKNSREFDPSKENKFKENFNILNSESEKQGGSIIKSNPNEIVSKTDIIDISKDSHNQKPVGEIELASLGMESNSISGAHSGCKKEENKTKNETNVLLPTKVKEICNTLQFENGSGGESETVYNDNKNNTSEDINVHKQNQKRLETSQFIENDLPHTSRPSECSSLCNNGELDSHSSDKKFSDDESLMMDDTDVESNFEGFTSSDQLEYSINFYQSIYNLKRCEVNLKHWRIKDSVLSNFSKELMLDKPNFRQVKRKLEDMIYDSQIEEENISKRIKIMRQEKKNVLKNIVFQVKKIKKKYGFTK
ncbi:UNVERIFIED_CONTAM: hypothetical protein RMT77_011164 [Armadillidium vulgare]